MNSLFGKILLWFWAALVINTHRICPDHGALGAAPLSDIAADRFPA